MEPSVSQRMNLTNFRISQRNIPSRPLQPYLDARPVMTKYSVLPVIDYRKPVATPLLVHSYEGVFNPGDTGPWSGYATKVNHESDLRNLLERKNQPNTAFIPSSHSSLYQVAWSNPQENHVVNPFPELFNTAVPPSSSNSNANANSFNKGNQLFYFSARDNNAYN